MRIIPRLIAIWRIITKRNFILIEVEEFVVENNQRGRNVRALIRTDYSIESDLLTLEAAKVQLNKELTNGNNSLLQLMHDTMSPVNTIKGSVDLLKQGGLSAEETNKLLDAIKERADKLNEVLDAYYVSQKELEK